MLYYACHSLKWLASFDSHSYSTKTLNYLAKSRALQFVWRVEFNGRVGISGLVCSSSNAVASLVALHPPSILARLAEIHFQFWGRACRRCPVFVLTSPIVFVTVINSTRIYPLHSEMLSSQVGFIFHLSDETLPIQTVEKRRRLSRGL